MSAGLIASSSNQDDTSFYRKEWSGGNDKVNKSAFNSYNMQLRVYSQKPATGLNGIGTFTVLWGYYHPQHYLYGDDGEIHQKVVSKLADQLKGHDFNLAVSVAELPQSLKTVVDNVRWCMDFLKALKTGNLSKISRTIAKVGKAKPRKGPGGNVKKHISVSSEKAEVGDIADLWLQYQYAWRPLVADLSAAIDFLNLELTQPLERIVKASARSSIPKYVDLRPSGSSKACPGLRYTSCTLTMRVTEAMSVTQSLGLDNLASVVWEKIPFSFVADWFIPIGNYLSDRATLNGLSSEYCYTYHNEIRFDYSFIVAGFYQPTPGNWKGKFIDMVRTRSTGNPTPTPVFKSFAKAFSQPHLINAAALVTGIVRPMSSR